MPAIARNRPTSHDLWEHIPFTLPAPQVQGPPMACELSRSHTSITSLPPRGGSGPTHPPGEPRFSRGDPRPPKRVRL
jgi:hypothetical protein